MDITFKKGIPGFENLNRFTLNDLEENKNFKILKSNNEEVSFVTVSPFDIYNDYEINLNDEIIDELQIKKSDDVLVLSIITLGKTLGQSTMNLKAPIVINIKNKLGKQYILNIDKYNTKHPLIKKER